MATRVLVIFPELDTADIENFRTQWDPLAQAVPAHLTIAFPIDWPDAASSLAEVLTTVAAEQAAFPIRLARPVIWDDEYLFLLMDQGHDEAQRLHEAVYRLALPGIRRPQHFIPHMTVGRRACAAELANRHARSERDTATHQRDGARVVRVPQTEERRATPRTGSPSWSRASMTIGTARHALISHDRTPAHGTRRHLR